MSLRLLLPQTATIYRQASTGAADRYGNPTVEDDAGTQVRCRLVQQQGRETGPDEESQIAELVLYLEADAQVDGTDRVEVDGDVYTVEGPVAQIYDRRRLHHQEARVRRVED